MNTTTLNMTTLDGGNVIIKRGEGGGSTPMPPSGGDTKPRWTGHADAEGLKAIGWTDEDIAYYQENGVNWNEEDDEYHKVTDDNKALYGVLTADNIADYKERIVYLPKIDTSGATSMRYMFVDCYSLVAIPMLDTSNVTDMYGAFSSCYPLVTIPKLDTSKVTDMRAMFYSCYSLTSIPMLDTSNVTSMWDMFESCYSLVTIPKLDTSKVTDMAYMFSYCEALVFIPSLDTSNVTDMSDMFYYCETISTISQLDCSNITKNHKFTYCSSLAHLYLKNVKSSCDLSGAYSLTKDSLLYLINNEASTSAITITLASYAYTRLANDPDIVAALANHPNISLAK